MYMYFVGEGFSTIMDTMENTLGAIPPEELAFMRTTKEEKSDDDQQSKEITEQPKSQESKEGLYLVKMTCSSRYY